MSEAPAVRYERRGPAAWLVLDRPDKRNALSETLIADFAAAFDRAESDPAVRAVVITGSGKAFCAGADLEAGLPRQDPGSSTEASGPANPFARLLHRLQISPKPVIAAVNGLAFGGGLGLIAAADVAIAASDATFSFSEVRLGLIPAMISVVVLPKIGPHHARRLFLTGRRFSAEEAVDYGLLHQVVAPGKLEDAVEREVVDVAKGGPRAVAEAKRLVREIPKLDVEEAYDRAAEWLAELAGSDEAREGIAAFSQKRPPSWRA